MALSQERRDEIIAAMDAIREAFDKMIEARVALPVAALRTIDVSISKVSEDASEEATDLAVDTILGVLS